jgi:hypothetical protein
MSDYWGVPEQEYELSLLQFARDELFKMGYSILTEKVEVCSGAGALTLAAILINNDSKFGLYIRDGPKHRKSRGPPIVWVLKLLPEMKTAEELRKFIILHQNDFLMILSPENSKDADRIQADIKKVYTSLYISNIKDLYDKDLSSATEVLRIRLRKNSG